jgi:carbonic anhydrase
MKPSVLPRGSLAIVMTVWLVTTLHASGKGAHWGYEGHEGPAHWGEMSKDYQTCMAGEKQSPIDISAAETADLAAIEFHYAASHIDMVNNGHTIQVNYAGDSKVTVAGKTYTLLQFHFHSPSEHTINGKAADMVAHLVHQAEDGQLGVIGVLMNKGAENKTIASLWQHMPAKSGDHKKARLEINVADLLPADRSYFNYSGSLTTPPCSEGVNWMVLRQPVEVSAEQIAAFNKLFARSVRPVQSLNGRVVKTGK